MSLLNADIKKSTRFNWVMLSLVFMLLGIGLVNLYSALGYWGNAGGHGLFWSQMIWVGIGLILMFFLAFFDYRLIEKIALPLYIVSILILVAVLFFGKEVAGHKSWLSLGPVAIQPSEFAKIALIIVLAKFFSNRPRPEGVDIFGLWQPILYSVIPTMLVAMQGDLGSAIFFVLIFGTFAWFGRLKGRGIATLILLGVVSSVLLYFFALSGYQKGRIISFMDPSADARGSGYHLVQSQIAVGSGRIFGKGYLKGNINKLKYLPEKHTDFIFPVLAEEWGFAGSAAVIVIYFLLFASGVEIARKSRDRIGLFLAIGIIAFIFWHVVINLCGVLGMMPLTGVPLPLMSYGGSSMIVVMGSIGILFSIGLRRFLF